RWRAVRATAPRFTVRDFRSARTTGGLCEFAADAGNVRERQNRGDALSGATRTGDAARIVKIGTCRRGSLEQGSGYEVPRPDYSSGEVADWTLNCSNQAC